jgi:hypothetical protein
LLLGDRGQQQINLRKATGERPLHPPPPSISAKCIRRYFINRQQKVQLFEDMLRGNLSVCDLLGTDANRKVFSRVCFGPGNRIPLRDMVTFMSEYSIPI